MKRLFTAFLPVIFACLMLELPASGQIFGGGISITGTTNSSAFQTNYAYVTLPPRTVYLSGVSNTNTVFLGYYTMTLDGTNLVVVASVTNSFSAGTNNATISIPQTSFAVPVYSVYQAHVGTNSLTVYIP